MDNGKSIEVVERCLVMTAYVTHESGTDDIGIIVRADTSPQRKAALINQFLALVGVRQYPHANRPGFSWGMYVEEALVSSNDEGMKDYQTWGEGMLPAAVWTHTPTMKGVRTNGQK